MPEVSPWSVDLQGRTPLALAAAEGHLEVCLLLKVTFGCLVCRCTCRCTCCRHVLEVSVRLAGWLAGGGGGGHGAVLVLVVSSASFFLWGGSSGHGLVAFCLSFESSRGRGFRCWLKCLRGVYPPHPSVGFVFVQPLRVWSVLEFAFRCRGRRCAMHYYVLLLAVPAVMAGGGGGGGGVPAAAAAAAAAAARFYEE